jgi:hypothetical protein
VVESLDLLLCSGQLSQNFFVLNRQLIVSVSKPLVLSANLFVAGMDVLLV